MRWEYATSLTISCKFFFPNAFWRSSVFVTSPLETFTKTLLTWSTSSKFVSLGTISRGLDTRSRFLTRQSSIPVLCSYNMRSNVVLIGCVRLSSAIEQTSNRFPPFLRRTIETFVSLYKKSIKEILIEKKPKTYLIWLDG